MSRPLPSQTALLQQLAQRVPGFTPLVVPASRVSVAEAVATYLFNSQLVSRADGGMALILPQEAQEHAGVWECLNELLAGDNPIADLRVLNLRESMANGGGAGVPAPAGGVDGRGVSGGQSARPDERYAVCHPQ